MKVITKYRITNQDGSWFETTDIVVAEQYPMYETIVEQIQDNKYVPGTASKMRFFLSLLNIGITRSMIYDEINKIEDPNTREVLLIKLDLSQDFDRNDEHLNMLATIFGVSQEQLDDLFIQSNN